jgi:hypothetical protein
MVYLAQEWRQPMLVVDATNPGDMRVVSEVFDESSGYWSPAQLAARGDTGYLATRHAGLLIMDLTDAAAPRITKRLNLPMTSGVRIQGDLLYVLSWDYGLMIGTLYALPLDCDGLSPVIEPTLQPHPTRLAQNHPNPFNPRTEISFTLESAQLATLKIFDLKGRLVRTLIDAERRPGGRQTVSWDGRDRGGRPAGAGVYLYRLEAERVVETKRMTLLK